MTLNLSDTDPSNPRRGLARSSLRARAGVRDRFSTDLFTGLNILVFMILAASVAGAAFLYNQGT